MIKKYTTARHMKVREMRNAGFSLLEIAMVLAIGAIIMAGVMMYYNTASVSQKTEDAMGEIASIQQAIHSLGAGQSDYQWLSTTGAQVLAQSGMLPAKWLSGSASTNSTGSFTGYTGINNPFGGAVTIGAGTTIGTNMTYTIQYANVPTQACTKLATTDLGSGVVKTTIGSTSSQGGGALSPTDANTACSATQKTTIIWEMY